MKKFKNYIYKALILTAVVFVAHSLSSWLEAKVVAGEPFAWAMLYAYYAAWLLASDYLADKIIGGD